MIPAPLPANESARLLALYDLNILDTEPEDAFDELARIASAICNTPISAVSLIDSKRQWFKARVGLDMAETAREMSFCGYAILKREPMIVADASKDERFADNPLVVGEPHIRFYAGMPLQTSEGLNVGSLCVIDSKPRELRPEQVAALEILAKQVMAHLEARLYARELEAVVKSLQKKEEEIEHYQHELETANAALKDLSVTDDLTQVKNRRAFRERIDSDYRLAMRHKQPLSVALIDVDHFKEFNDTYGHAGGDRVLRDVARILVETARTTDCVARYGGEEFIVLLPGTDASGARIIGDRFRAAIEQWKVKHGGATVSVGVATLDSSGQTLQQFLEAADRALYKAKLNGRNRTVHFQEMKAAAPSEIQPSEPLHSHLL